MRTAACRVCTLLFVATVGSACGGKLLASSEPGADASSGDDAGGGSHGDDNGATGGSSARGGTVGSSSGRLLHQRRLQRGHHRVAPLRA
jgi:hypothetical protein